MIVLVRFAELHVWRGKNVGFCLRLYPTYMNFRCGITGRALGGEAEELISNTLDVRILDKYVRTGQGEL